MSLLFFVFSLSIVIAAISRPNVKTGYKYYSLVAASLIYSAFCFVAYARMSGLIEGETLMDLINQSG